MSKENTKAKKICAALRRELQGAHALPSERALMRRFDAARETVRRALAEHLLARGACRSLFLTRPHAPPSNQLRYEGVRSRMDCNILQMEPDNATALRKALKRHRPDALACGYDAYAAQILKTLGALGVSVPNDILLTGFDDVKYATLVSPPLTTFRQPCADIARAAFETLLARTAEPDRLPRTILLNAPLVARESTSPNYLTKNRQIT